MQRQLSRKWMGLGGVAGLGEFGPEAAKAFGRPMCKGSCKEKGRAYLYWVSEWDVGLLGVEH